MNDLKFGLQIIGIALARNSIWFDSESCPQEPSHLLLPDQIRVLQVPEPQGERGPQVLQPDRLQRLLPGPDQVL